MVTDRDHMVGDAGPSFDRLRSSWGWIAASAVSRAYLSLLVSLVAIATLPLLLGWQASVVQSGSMLPHIQPGDVAVTMPLPGTRAVPVGRVVAFRTTADANADGRKAVRLHRIVAVNANGTFATKGDANTDDDSDPLVRSQIIGQARLLIPRIGLPSLWLGHGNLVAFAGWALATVLAFIIVAFDIRPTTSIPYRGRKPAEFNLEI